MKTIRIISIILFFSSCAKKQVPFFQNSIQPNYSTKNIIADKIEKVAIQNLPQNQDLASISPNTAFLKEDLTKENNIVVEEKTILKPKTHKKEKVKLKQHVKIKKAFSDDKPNYEKTGKVAATFGYITLGLIFLAIVLAFSSVIAIAMPLLTLALISGNIALLLGALSVKKAENKRKAKFAIAIGIVYDILIVSFIIWVLSI